MTRKEIAEKIEYEGLAYFMLEYASASDMPDPELEELFCAAQDALQAFLEVLPDPLDDLEDDDEDEEDDNE